MGALERDAVARKVRLLHELGVELPPDLAEAVNRVLCGQTSAGARLWAAAHPDDDPTPCCDGSAVYDQTRCTCWEPVYAVEQSPPRPPASIGDIQVRARMCPPGPDDEAGCAFRPGSPERTDPLLVDELDELVYAGTPFWCHTGMRRPVRWEHPDGRVIPGDPADWHPAMVGALPFRTDGQPALLCAGWWAAVVRARREAAFEDAAEQLLQPPAGQADAA